MNWQRAVRLLPLLAVLLFLGSCSKKTPTLNLLVWEGYADPSFIQAFEEANHCKVSASYMGSSDELVAKLRGGSAGTAKMRIPAPLRPEAECQFDAPTPVAVKGKRPRRQDDR